MTAGLSCRDVTESANAFVDGELTGARWLQFRIHLMMCAHCQEYLRQIQVTVDALRDLPSEDGAEMRSELMRRFQEWASESTED